MKRSIKLSIDDECGLGTILEAVRVSRRVHGIREFDMKDEHIASRERTIEEVRADAIAAICRDWLDSRNGQGSEAKA